MSQTQYLLRGISLNSFAKDGVNKGLLRLTKTPARKGKTPFEPQCPLSSTTKHDPPPIWVIYTMGFCPERGELPTNHSHVHMIGRMGSALGRSLKQLQNITL